MTGAGPDDHHRLLDDVPWGALELHLDGFGVVRGAAAAITADPAVPGLVGMQARAVLELQVDGFKGLHGTETPFSFLICLLPGLWFTGPHHAEPGPLHHLTLGIPVGDLRGEAHAAALGTRAPLCGLFNAVDP